MNLPDLPLTWTHRRTLAFLSLLVGLYALNWGLLATGVLLAMMAEALFWLAVGLVLIKGGRRLRHRLSKNHAHG